MIDIGAMIASRLRLLFLAALPAIVAGTGTAEARGKGDAYLQRCGSDTCVVVDGRRADPRASVLVADHPVVPSGGRAFRVALPVDQVRAWSEPSARSITLGIQEPDGTRSDRAVRLPIGLLGHTTELASLEISAR